MDDERLRAEWTCPRAAWENGGMVEQYCLFHSGQYERRREHFKKEIDALMRGIPSELFRAGQGETINVVWDFFRFRFPAGCADFRGASFRSDAEFNGTLFRGVVDFSGAKFRGVRASGSQPSA